MNKALKLSQSILATYLISPEALQSFDEILAQCVNRGKELFDSTLQAQYKSFGGNVQSEVSFDKDELFEKMLTALSDAGFALMERACFERMVDDLISHGYREAELAHNSCKNTLNQS